MKLAHHVITLFLLLVLIPGQGYASKKSDDKNAPDLKTLSKSGFIIGPGSEKYPVHKSWHEYAKVMKELSIYDRIVERVQMVLCSDDQNRSILIVGEASNAFRYVFARMASLNREALCEKTWHVEVDINQIEAGHRYVGDVEEYWQKSILKPADGKNVILYFRNLYGMMGMGSSSNDPTGVETEFAANIQAGRLRVIAFVNKFEYEKMRSSEYSYVINSFAEKINLNPITRDQVKVLVRTHMSTLYPAIKLKEQDLNYMVKTLELYQPNVNEPERTMNVLRLLLRRIKRLLDQSGETVLLEEPYETEHPYDNEMNFVRELSFDGVSRMQLFFESFKTEKDDDVLTVYDTSGEGEVLLDTFTGDLKSFKTGIYNTGSIKLVFTTDVIGVYHGFVMNKVVTYSYEDYTINFDELRRAIFDVIQVPSWIVDRDFSLVAELKEYLKKDVVGIKAGRQAVVRDAKIGYVVGRTTKKPVASILLVGPTGTGKSHLAKSTADGLDMPIITFDMTTYQSPASFTQFRRAMAYNLTINPYAVYLFEEIDKANVAILDQLFFMMDDGIFYDDLQRPLSARGAFIVMTTNAAHEVILEHKDEPDLTSRVNVELREYFRLSFLNRFNSVAISTPFTKKQYRKMAKNLAKKKRKKVRQRFGWELTVDKSVINYVAKHGRSAVYGSRPIERLMENILIGGIAEFELTQGKIPYGATIEITLLNDKKRLFTVIAEGKTLEFKASADNNNGL
jgi:MoxR-like ATPase